MGFTLKEPAAILRLWDVDLPFTNVSRNFMLFGIRSREANG